MRKKIEEEIAKLAFGELTADEASRLELRTQVDSEAAQTYQTYRRMKDELQMLSQDVPEDQLSKERLREAILTRGLKHAEPVASRTSWLWMPVAAAVIAFGAFYLKGNMPISGGSGSTVVFDADSVKSPELMPEFKITKPTRNEPLVVPNAERSPVVSTKPSTRVAMDTGRRSSRRSSSAGAATVVESPIVERSVLEASSGEVSFDRAPSGIGAPISEPLDFGPTADSEANRNSGTAPTIIVIQNETDTSTGALKATEVGDTANVLVGG